MLTGQLDSSSDKFLNGANDFRGVAGNHTACRDILGNHCSSTHDGTAANSHTHQHYCPVANETVVFDDDWHDG